MSSPPWDTRDAPEPHDRSLGEALEGACVLIVEDDADALEFLAALFQSSGATVKTAASVAAAWELLMGGGPAVDLLVSDIGLPVEDGYSLIQRLREQTTPLGDVPAIALTAYVRGEDRARALRSGFDAHTPKPVDPQHLVALAARVLAQNPSRSRI